MGKSLEGKITDKLETLYTNYWAIAAHLELSRNVELTTMEGENAGRVNTLKPRYTDIGD